MAWIEEEGMPALGYAEHDGDSRLQNRGLDGGSVVITMTAPFADRLVGVGAIDARGGRWFGHQWALARPEALGVR